MKMRPVILILCLFLSAPMLLSQESAITQQRINEIKMSPGKYLYGLCTMPGEPAPEKSRQEALLELRDKIDGYIMEKGQSGDFIFLTSSKTIPEDRINVVSYLRRQDCWRTMAFIEKAEIEQIESDLAREYNNVQRRAAVDSLVLSILAASTINDVSVAVAKSSLSENVIIGSTFDDGNQSYVNEAFLIYFEPKTGKVLEVMAPVGPDMKRKNARTGEKADPLRYRTIPLWVYIDGLKIYYRP